MEHNPCNVAEPEQNFWPAGTESQDLIKQKPFPELKMTTNFHAWSWSQPKFGLGASDSAMGRYWLCANNLGN